MSFPLSPQEAHVNIGPETGVERKVPAHMVGIVIDHHPIAVPVPVVGITVVVFGNSEVVAVEPETLTVAAAQHPDMFGAAIAKPSMLPGMIDMIIPNIAVVVTVMANPVVTAVDVR